MRQLTEHWHIVDIEARYIVAKQPADVEEESRTAAQIQNALGARQIELDLADTPNVDADPTIQVEILRPIFSGIFDRVSTVNPLKLWTIDCLNDVFGGKRKTRTEEKSPNMATRTAEAFPVEQLVDLVPKSHSE